MPELSFSVVRFKRDSRKLCWPFQKTSPFCAAMRDRIPNKLNVSAGRRFPRYFAPASSAMSASSKWSHRCFSATRFPKLMNARVAGLPLFSFDGEHTAIIGYRILNVTKLQNNNQLSGCRQQLRLLGATEILDIGSANRRSTAPKAKLQLLKTLESQPFQGWSPALTSIWFCPPVDLRGR